MATEIKPIQGTSPAGYDGKTTTPLTEGALGTNTNVGTQNLATTPINSATMKSVTPVPLATPSPATNYSSTIANSLADITTQQNNAQAQVDAFNKQGKETSASVANLQSLLGGKGADTTKIYEEQGVNKVYNQLADLNAQATGLKNEALAIPIQIQNEFKGTGATDAGVAPIETSRLRDNALKALSLGQQAAIATAQYDKAKNYADQLVNAKYDQIQADITAKLTNLQALKDFDLTPAQEKARLAREEKLNAEKVANEDKRINEKAISDLIIQASSQNAPQTLLAKAKDLQLKGAKSSEVAMVLGQYGGDYYKTELLKQQIATEKAQRAKIYSEMGAGGGTGAVLGVEGINPLKFKDSQARTDFTKAGAVVEAIKATLSGAQKDENGNYYGLGYGGGNKPEVFLDQAGQTNRAFLSGINLKTQQWASGASLTAEQIAMVNKMVPQPTDADSTITRKLNALEKYMTNEQKAIARTQGQSVIEQPEPNVFTQALGQPASKFEGTSIIKDISDKGIDFALPTTTNIKVK